MSLAARAPWRRRLSELARGIGKPHPPLFAPLLWAVACQVEALSPFAFTTDPTKLTRGLIELARALELEAIVTACPAAMEAEALGVPVDREVWPPQARTRQGATLLDAEDLDVVWSRSAALAAALEATRRVAARDRDEGVILAALTGPATLQAQLAAPGDALPEYERVGRALAALVRRYAEAGMTVVLLSERTLPDDEEGWTSALRTVANIAKFHRIPVLLGFEDGNPPSTWPSFVVPCLPPRSALPAGRPFAAALDPEPAGWSAGLAATPGARVAVTRTEVAPTTPIGTLQAAVAAVRSAGE